MYATSFYVVLIVLLWTGGLDAGRVRLILFHGILASAPSLSLMTAAPWIVLVGDDISSLVIGEERLEVLQAGKTLFVVARTAEFDAMVDATDDDGARELMERIERCWQTVYDRSKGTMPEKAEAATVQTCQEFKLAYYRGQGVTLNRVE